MSSRLFSLSEIATKLREFAMVLSVGAFVDAPNILNSIANDIEKGQFDQQRLQMALEKVRESIWREFCDEPWKKPILEEVDAILAKGSPSFTAALSLLEEAKGPTETCTQIMRLVATQTSSLVRMHLYCYIYLLQVEGAYDQVLRFLYAIFTKAPSSKADVRSISDNFKNANVGTALIDGWNSLFGMQLVMPPIRSMQIAAWRISRISEPMPPFSSPSTTFLCSFTKSIMSESRSRLY
jgi:hypothetical protein